MLADETKAIKSVNRIIDSRKYDVYGIDNLGVILNHYHINEFGLKNILWR